MRIRILSYAIVLTFTTQMALCQTIKIEGQILDSLSNSTIENAIVYITTDSLFDYLAYTMSGANGMFLLQLKQNVSDRILYLHIRYLGYENKRVRLTDFSKFYTIGLSPSENLLPDIEITDREPPIVRKSDTIVYDLSQFRDSTEYNIEDLLKKLPGIEVSSDGSIKANGKPIEKLLIEGTDLFGRKYTMGTKNIRADYINKVEVIDRFQENPVLKNVNISDQIVLNLLLDEKAKNIISGSLELGGGFMANNSMAYKSNANVFWISKKKKYILLTDNGNTITNYSIRELDQIYGTFSSKDITNKEFRAEDFQVFLGTQNPGISDEFVDDSKRSFFTLRSETDLSKLWKLQINGVYASKSDNQLSSSRTGYLFDPNQYTVLTNTELNLKRKLYNGDAKLKYLAEDNTSSFDAFIKWGKSPWFNKENITEITSTNTYIYQSQSTEIPNTLFMAGLYSHSLSTNSAAQFLVVHHRFERPQTLLTQNENLPNLLEFPSEFSKLDQSISYWNDGTKIASRLLFNKKILLLEAEAAYSFDKAGFRNHAYLFDTKKEVVSLFPNMDNLDSIKTSAYGLNVNALVNLSPKTSLRLYNAIQKASYTLLDVLGKPVDYKANNLEFLTDINLNYEISRKSSLKLFYKYRQINPRSEDYFRTAYFRSGYELVMQRIQSENEKGHQIGALYRYSNPLKLKSFSLNFRYRFGNTQWMASSDFNNSILIAAPFLSESPNRLNITAKYSCFFPIIKSNVELKPFWSYLRRNAFVANKPIDLSVTNVGMFAAIRFHLLRSFIVSLENKWTRQVNSTYERHTASTVVRNTFQLNFRKNGWNIFTSINNNLWFTDFGNNALVGIKSGLTKAVHLSQKKMIIRLDVVNLRNTKNYGRTSNSDLFSFSNSVESVPMYFLLSCDYSLH